MEAITLSEDFLPIMNGLQNHHALFGEFWSVGDIVEDSSIPTACIKFDESGTGYQFAINPDFWRDLELVEKMFVISHECLHVYFDHGKRGMALARSKNNGKLTVADMQRINIAGDVVINHYLCRVFGFSRSDLKFTSLPSMTRPDGTKVSGADTLCWIDTVFYDDPTVEGERSMEYYYEKLVEQEEGKNQGSGGEAPDWVRTLDDHDAFNEQAAAGDDNGEGGGQEDDKEDKTQQIVDDLTNRITDEELEDFEKRVKDGNPAESKSAQAGSMAGGLSKFIRLGKIVKKKKWETIIEDVLGRFKGTEQPVTIEQWARPNRRMASLSGGDLMLPSEIDDIVPIRDRIDVWVFQDISGSCVSYADRFFKAAASIPEKRFKIRGFTFDTRVKEVDVQNPGRISMGGGTAFNIIEEKIQEITRNEKLNYPQAVFIITDGYGNCVNPQYPDRWHWFLTPGGGWGSQTEYISTKSSHYELKDFE